MEHRYSLRFESGERRGETIPITPGGLSVGRKPGNSLQILDNSVSGKHAELVVEADVVKLRDLGSTNGTRVGAERVLETRLVHGDAVTFGNVNLVFQDAELGTAPPLLEPTLEPTAVVPVAARAGEGLERVSADVVARSKKVSPLGLVVLLVLVAGGAVVWWRLELAGREGAGETRPVAPIAGNLLPAAGSSFEVENDGWESLGQAPIAFERSTSASASGEFGFEADLAAGEWALDRSPAVRADAGQAIAARATVRVAGEDGALATLGIEFSSSTAGEAAPAPVIAWGTRVGPADGERASELVANVPPGYDTARAVVHAAAGPGSTGTVAVDDVALLARPADPAQTIDVGEYRWARIGPETGVSNLSKGDRVLLSGVRGADEVADGIVSTTTAFDARAEGGQIRFAPRGEGPVARRLVLRAAPALVRAGLATIGADGYRTHGLDFERAGVSSLLLGGGRDFVRIAFPSPVSVRGREDGNGCTLAATLEPGGGEPGEIVLQVDFKEERTKAGDIAHAARNAEKRGELGSAIVQWTTLLDGFPFEEALVTEAEAARGRLIQKGLEELQSVRGEVERARFFRLADLYRRCRDKALAVGAQYAESEVQAQAKELAAEVDLLLVDLEGDLLADERRRLSAILGALEAEQAEGLAGEVRAYLAEHLGASK